MAIEPKITGTKRWVKVLLVVSLGLNLAVLGMATGLFIQGPPSRPTPQNQDAVAFLSFALPEQHRQEIRKELLTHRESLRENRGALRGLRMEMIEILQEEPFQIEKIEHVLEQQRGQFVSLGALAHDALVRRISALTPDERALYVESLRRNTRPRRIDKN